MFVETEGKVEKSVHTPYVASPELIVEVSVDERSHSASRVNHQVQKIICVHDDASGVLSVLDGNHAIPSDMQCKAALLVQCVRQHGGHFATEVC